MRKVIFKKTLKNLQSYVYYNTLYYKNCLQRHSDAAPFYYNI